MGGDKVILKTAEEIDLIRESSLLVSRVLGELKNHIRPGVSTQYLDEIAETFIRDHGGVPAFKNYSPRFGSSPFPSTLCTSIDSEVVHGMPSAKRILKEGSIISVDCGVLMNGYYGDSAYTFAVGEVSPKVLRLMDVTKQALYRGIEKAVVGSRLGDVSHAIQRHAETYGYGVVREMVGHGVGKHLHEAPEIPNYGKRKTGIPLKEGMVLAIEPMINMGRRFIKVADDGWTVSTVDNSPSAHYEHCVVVRNGKAEILSTFEFIEN
ncbi:MAG: type I methionyl aminopeptidase [Bacteroidia bacterium]